MSKAQVPGVYAGRLAAFGDPVLDAMHEEASCMRVRVIKERISEPAKCPSCERVKILRKSHFATLCEECHAGIDDLVRRPRW